MITVNEAVEQLVDARAEVIRLREGIQAFIDGSADTMPRDTIWRKDGVHSKHDKCPHGQWMYDGCENCADVYFQRLLAQHKEAS